MSDKSARKNWSWPSVVACILSSILICAMPYSASGLPGGEERELKWSGASSPWGLNFALYVHLKKIEHSAIEERIAYFQPTNEISDAITAALILGARRHSNRIELDILLASNFLIHFMDDEHYLEVDEAQLLLWYRREFPFRLGGLDARLLPGAGAGYTSAIATVVHNSDSRSNLLKASALTFGVGARLELRVFSPRKSGVSYGKNSLDFGIDYSYRFDDMKATAINEGDIFFPAPTEFAVTGHYIALGLQYSFAK